MKILAMLMICLLPTFAKGHDINIDIDLLQLRSKDGKGIWHICASDPQKPKFLLVCKSVERMIAEQIQSTMPLSPRDGSSF